MSDAPRARATVALGIAASVAFAVLAHAALVDRLPPAAGALLCLVPAAIVALYLARRSSHRGLAVLALLAAAAALAAGWSHLEAHFVDLFFVQHAGTNLALAALFGRTLAGGREPLVTRFARVIHGTLPERVERYTRRVTIAWTLFFCVLFAASCALYFSQRLAAWSFLANIASPALIAAMFVVEYAIRLRALPDWEQVGILGGIRAFSRHFASARPQAPR